MEYYYFWFVLFTISAYLIVTDSSVAKLFYFVSKLIKFQYEKTKWWLIHNPSNPIVKYLIWKRSMKIAEELRRELQEGYQSKENEY